MKLIAIFIPSTQVLDHRIYVLDLNTKPPKWTTIPAKNARDAPQPPPREEHAAVLITKPSPAMWIVGGETYGDESVNGRVMSLHDTWRCDVTTGPRMLPT